jgi:DNA end-binding protein Ku
VIERSDTVKGYEFEKDKYVVFEPSELEAFEATANHSIDIVAFLPADAIDPISGRLRKGGPSHNSCC